MRFFKLIVLSALLSATGFAGNTEDIKLAALKYQRAMDAKNKVQLKTAVTESYYKKLSKNDLLERLMKNKKKSSQKVYTVEIVESKVVKGGYMASLKEKGKEKESDHDHKIWLKLEKVNDKFLVSDEVHAD